MKTLFVLFISCSFWTYSGAQGIFSNPITDSNPSTANPFTSGQTVNSNITVSGIGRGSGISANAGSNRYNANSWNTGSLDNNAYFAFAISPKANFEIDFISFVYTGQASGTGPSNFALRSSLDGFTSNIGTPTSSGTTISLSAAAFQNIQSAIEFRLFGWGASSAAGTFSINDFTFNGTVAAIPLPVTLLNFELSKENNNHLLSWTYESPDKFDYFELQHSRDAILFENLYRFYVELDSRESKVEYLNSNPESGIHYYRLKMVDLDGSFDYSHIIQGNINSDEMGIKPLTTFISDAGIDIMLDKEIETYSLNLYDSSGKIIFHTHEQGGRSIYHLQVYDLPAGIYMLQASANGQYRHFKLIR